MRKTATIKILKENGNFENVNLKQREIDFIKNICITGAITQAFLSESLGEKRIRKLCSSGILKKVDKPHREEINGKIVNRHLYTLGPEGQNFALEKEYANQLQGANGYKHAEKMERVVDDLLVNKNIDIKNIYNEKDQKKVFRKELRQLRADKIKYHINDIAYKNNEGAWHSVEIVTSNYGKQLLQKHENFAKSIGATYQKI